MSVQITFHGGFPAKHQEFQVYRPACGAELDREGESTDPLVHPGCWESRAFSPAIGADEDYSDCLSCFHVVTLGKVGGVGEKE